MCRSVWGGPLLPQAGRDLMLFSRNVRAANLTFWRGVNPDAQRLMLANMILTLLMMGVDNVARVLFVLRLNLGTEFFGTFNTFRALGFTGLSLPAGVLGSRIGLKNSMLLGASMLTLGFVGGSLVESLPSAYWKTYTLGTQLVATGGFALFWVNASPALMSTTRPHNRSKIYGTLSASGNFGALFGMLAGGFLPTTLARFLNLSLDTTHPYRLALLGCTLFTVPVLLALARFKGEHQPGARNQTGERKAFPLLPMALLLLFVLLSQGAQAACYAFCNAYMDVQLHLSPDVIGVLGALGQLSAVLLPFTVPFLTRHMQKPNLLVATTVGTGLMLAPLTFIENWVGAGIGRLGVVSLAAIWNPVLQIFQMEMVPPEWRPLAFALMSVAQGLNYGILSFLGGRAINLWGFPTLFLICAGLTATGSLLLFVVRNLPFLQPQYAN